MSAVVPFMSAGNITAKESALNALTQWANDCERKLLIGLSCGTVLPRVRHREWASQRIASAKYLGRRRGKNVSGLILLPPGDQT